MNNQKFDTSSLQGQKQLIDLGKTLENVRELEEIRSQKENDLDEYLNAIKIKIPEGSKKDNYTNTIRNMIYENKEGKKNYSAWSPRSYYELNFLTRDNDYSISMQFFTLQDVLREFRRKISVVS